MRWLRVVLVWAVILTVSNAGLWAGAIVIAFVAHFWKLV